MVGTQLITCLVMFVFNIMSYIWDPYLASNGNKLQYEIRVESIQLRHCDK